jgi:hypothetical protein
MSRLKFSFQHTEPGSLASPSPVWLRACQTPNTAPDGSAATAIRPTSITSMGATSTVPPAAVTLPAVSSASSEAM